MKLTELESWSIARLGYLYYSREHFTEAEAIFAGLATLCPHDHYCWHVLGLIARRQKSHIQSVQYFQHALKLAPDAYASRVAMAETLFEAGQIREAREALATLQNHPQPAPEAVRRGQVLWARWSK
ncbi:MAG: tetratricopeptide repeat protein [Bradymonadaceae bacterium]|nr:tetratricopeptide repeat protein [Lujinxingiaceae bacterium]